jgi:exonuclease III
MMSLLTPKLSLPANQHIHIIASGQTHHINTFASPTPPPPPIKGRTHNLNGIGTKQTIHKLEHAINDACRDNITFLLIQETHIKSNNHLRSLLTAPHKNHQFFLNPNRDNHNKGGTLTIFLQPQHNSHITEVHESYNDSGSDWQAAQADNSKGKLQQISFTYNKELYKISNIYAPSTLPDREHFYRHTRETNVLRNSNGSCERLLIGGDFNNTPDPDRDRSPKIADDPHLKCHNHTEEYMLLITDLLLLDPYDADPRFSATRVQHTFHKHDGYSARLDRFLFSEDLTGKVAHTDSSLTALSDHMPVTCTLDLSVTPRIAKGSDVMRINTST